MLFLIPVCVLFAVATSLRLNCGGGKIGGIQGDASSTAGRFTGTNNSPVSIYTTHAFGKGKKLVYTILAPGTKDGYDVKLFFMENNPKYFGEGKRVFDVYLIDREKRNQIKRWKNMGRTHW